MQTPITDDQVISLIPRCQRGDQVAVETLYMLYSDRIYRYLLARVGDPEQAADLTTEAFVRVIEHLSGFRLNRQRPAASFSAWLYRIAANLAADHHRRRRHPEQVSLEVALPLSGSDPGPDTVIEHQESVRRLAQALQALSEDQRLVIIGKFVEGMSNSEVAAWLGKTEGAIKSLQHRALQTLGRLLRAGGGTP